ncbi:hypothetical protein GCM10027058_31490 [Microbacterium neimengense]
MVMYGADVQGLRQLAQQFEHKAAQLDQDRMTVGNAIQVSAWVGPVAVRFRHEWDSSHSRAVHNAAGRLRDAAAALRRNADEQEKTSSVGSSSGGGGGAAGGGSASGGKLPDLLRWLVDDVLIDGSGWVSERVDFAGLAIDYFAGTKQPFDPWKVFPNGSYVSSALKGIGLGDAGARFAEAWNSRDYSGAMLAAADAGSSVLPPGLSQVWSGLRDMTGFFIPLDDAARDEHMTWMQEHHPGENLGDRYSGLQGFVNLGNDNVERKAPWLNRAAETVLEKPAKWLYDMGIKLY